MTLTSGVTPPGSAVSSTIGAISDASISRASLAGETSTCCRGTGSVSLAMLGCTAEAPHAE